jgi:vacuolar-type H+-ATPase subunit H
MLRLSELLERIRPAGSPGAAAEGEQQHRDAMVQDEIAEVARLLAEFEREADRVVDDARREADHLRQDGERRAHQILAGRADRVAVAEAEATSEQEDRETDDRDDILATARADIARMKQRADDRLPELVDAIVESIWAVDR